MDRMFEENGIIWFRNDYEYALWALFMRSMFDKELYVQVYDVLRDYDHLKCLLVYIHISSS